MALRVLLVQSETKTAQVLSEFFANRGDTVWQATDASKARELLTSVIPDLVLLDLHLPGSDWLNSLALIRKQYPSTKIIVTNQRPDVKREQQAREYGVSIFLRQPFTHQWIESALKQLSGNTRSGSKNKPEIDLQNALPRVRVPVRVKITGPYVLLALVFALAAGYLVSQVVLDTTQERFTNQLIKTGKQASDWMVREENRLLETRRLVANSTGIVDLVRAGNADGLRQLILPLAINAREEDVEVLDTVGLGILSLRHVSGGNQEAYTGEKGETLFKQVDFVRPVLAGVVEQNQDKYAGLVRASWGDYFYVSGPIYASDGKLAGVVLVGKSLTTLVHQMSTDTMADITFYSIQGQPLASTLFPTPQDDQPLTPRDALGVLTVKDQSSLMRKLSIASNRYSEIVGPWEVRGNTNLGEMGVALSEYLTISTSTVTRAQVVVLVLGVLLLVILVGVLLSNRILRPLLRVVGASSEVARGNLEVKVDSRGDDEVAVLAYAFNRMVVGLQEGSMYRDLLGRTVSPEVREQLRQTFTTGNLRLEGQEAVATVLMSDIRGFTNLSERSDPTTVFRWLNEYFSELVPIITAHGGVVNKFDGDAMLAFFGILPRMTNPKQSAYAACQVAVEMYIAIGALNERRSERNEPPLFSGIGINTGVITAGGLGTSDRLHYTIIGDTVNTTQRLESLTRQVLETSGVIISHSTYLSLGEYREHFQLVPLGSFAVKGKAEELLVYHLLPKPVLDSAQEKAAA